MQSMRGQILKYKFLWVWPSQKFPLHQKLPHTKFWCFEMAQWSQIWLNKHQIYIGSFLISTILMFTKKLLLHKSRFLHIWNNGLVIFNNMSSILHCFYFWSGLFEWWCYPTPSEGWRSNRTLQRPNSWATRQVQTAEPKIDLHRSSEARQQEKDN